MSRVTGTAVVTESAAALWTDGRYFLQAEAELHPEFKLMRMGEDGTPSVEDWLSEVLRAHLHEEDARDERDARRGTVCDAGERGAGGDRCMVEVALTTDSKSETCVWEWTRNL